MKRFLGLDVHKSVVEVCAIDDAGNTLFRRRVDCTREVLLKFAEELTAGELLSLTDSRHSVEALEDSVFLLTTVSRPSDGYDPRVA